MTDQHTPGPWRVGDYETGGLCIFGTTQGRYGPTTVTVARVTRVGYSMPTEVNARLIAAAPDLLAALERFAKWSMQGSYPEIQGIITDAHEAIRKATGEDA